MITYEEAKKIALSRHDYYDSCIEFEDGWWFSSESHSCGRGDNTIVVTKAGEMMSFVSFLDSYADRGIFFDEEGKEIPF